MNYLNKTYLLHLYLYIRNYVVSFINIIKNRFFSIREVILFIDKEKKNITTQYIFYLFFSKINIFFKTFLKYNYNKKLKYDILHIKKIYNSNEYKLILSNEKKNIIYLNEYINKNIIKMYQQFTPIITEYYIYTKNNRNNLLDIKCLIKDYHDINKLFDHTLKNIFIINNIEYDKYDTLYYDIFDNLKGPISKTLSLNNILHIHISDIYTIKN
jgi:hypothetical protein